MYIADRDNGRIQKWIQGSSSGITVAGGNGKLPSPTDVYVDSYGTVYALTSYELYQFKAGATWGTLIVSTYYFNGYYFVIDAYGDLNISVSLNNAVQKYARIGAGCGELLFSVIATVQKFLDFVVVNPTTTSGPVSLTTRSTVLPSKSEYIYIMPLISMKRKVQMLGR